MPSMLAIDPMCLILLAIPLAMYTVTQDRRSLWLAGVLEQARVLEAQHLIPHTCPAGVHLARKQLQAHTSSSRAACATIKPQAGLLM